MSIFYLQLSTIVLSLFVGVCLSVLSRYIKIPSIVLFLIAGVVLGPEFLGIIDPASYGDELRLIISMSVAVILFEGGLTLHPDGLKKAPTVIWRLLSLGVIVTWFGTSALIFWMMDFSLSVSLAAGSLVIVTGPTVIAPMLKRVHVKDKLFHILHWEGVLIDPIGVFIAILCFEWLSIEGSIGTHILQLSFRLATGILIGVAGGWFISFLLKKDIVPEKQSNIFVFSSALFLFGLSDFIIHESGILTVVITGFVVGWTNPPRLKYIQQFKSDLTDLAVALVFILLAASLDLKNFYELKWQMLVVLGCILFLLRPLSILLCTYRTGLSLNEKLFLSWISPRGVVAGSMASLFGLRLMEQGYEEAFFFETFTFSVIAASVIIQGGTAGTIAKWLNVKETDKKGWLIVGAHLFSRKIAEFITQTSKGSCVFLDTNAEAVSDTQSAGHTVFQGNALSTESLPVEVTSTIGNVLALTDNRDLNQLICEKWSETIDYKNLYRWSSQSADMEREIGGMGLPVWTKLPKPSRVAFEIKNKEMYFNHLRIDGENKKPKTGIHLISENKGKLFFDAPAKQPGGSFDVLMLKQASHHLVDLLQLEHILFLKPNDYKDSLIEILTRIEELYPDVKCAGVSSGLLEKEKQFPTVLAHGVAAPHLHCSGLDEPICFLARAQKGMGLKTFDEEEVQLIFVLISPQDNPETHLRLLAQIAHLTGTKDQVAKLLTAKNSTELIERL